MLRRMMIAVNALAAVAVIVAATLVVRDRVANAAKPKTEPDEFEALQVKVLELEHRQQAIQQDVQQLYRLDHDRTKQAQPTNYGPSGMRMMVGGQMIDIKPKPAARAEPGAEAMP